MVVRILGKQTRQRKLYQLFSIAKSADNANLLRPFYRYLREGYISGYNVDEVDRTAKELYETNGNITFSNCKICNKDVPESLIFQYGTEEYYICENCVIEMMKVFGWR